MSDNTEVLFLALIVPDVYMFDERVPLSITDVSTSGMPATLCLADWLKIKPINGIRINMPTTAQNFLPLFFFTESTTPVQIAIANMHINLLSFNHFLPATRHTAISQCGQGFILRNIVRDL